jgi:nitrogen fixation protein NifX
VAIGEAVFASCCRSACAPNASRQTTIVGLLQEIQLYWYDKEQRKSAPARPDRFARLLQEQGGMRT